jgi:dihydrofolate reductase
MKAIISHNKFGFIGLNGELPWRSREDLKHFKDLTIGCKLLVGYNTSINLPPLKDRELVIDDRYNLIETDLIDWCIGGKKTYEKYCHLFTELHVSIIDDETIGDTVYPNLINLNKDCKIIYYHFYTDKKIMAAYMAGFNDELNDSKKEDLKNETLNYAYTIGRQDAIIGDGITNSDNQSNSKILNRIINKH